MFSKHAKRPTRTVARDSTCDNVHKKIINNTRLKKGNDEESEFFYFFITVTVSFWYDMTYFNFTVRTVRQLFSKIYSM